MSDSDTMQVRVLGCDIGTASGWDQVGDSIIYFYDFENKTSSKELDKLNGGFSFDYENGTFTAENGTELKVLEALN